MINMIHIIYDKYDAIYIIRTHTCVVKMVHCPDGARYRPLNGDDDDEKEEEEEEEVREKFIRIY